MGFCPDEILFSPTARCNLSCTHCVDKPSGKYLPIKVAEKFLADCRRCGIDRVGFTGGEPFLAPLFLKRIIRESVKKGMFFSRIMTNGVWYKNRPDLIRFFVDLKKAGYDGSLCVSIDAFHSQKPAKLAFFIKTAIGVWKRPDVVSVACVTGKKDSFSIRKLRSVARLIGARAIGLNGPHPRIKGKSLFIRIYRVKLCPISGSVKPPFGWDGKMLVEDYCRGPGNVFLVEPSGEVKPCCGYASDLDELSIGSIKKDSVRNLLKKAGMNRFVYTIFNSGLGQIRKKLERAGVRFPGKTGNHCYLCRYILTTVDPRVLAGCLD